ncbi:hypothetical protein AOLI_G00092970 [Acnodon oligacanthus]
MSPQACYLPHNGPADDLQPTQTQLHCTQHNRRKGKPKGILSKDATEEPLLVPQRDFQWMMMMYICGILKSSYKQPDEISVSDHQFCLILGVCGAETLFMPSLLLLHTPVCLPVTGRSCRRDRQGAQGPGSRGAAIGPAPGGGALRGGSEGAALGTIPRGAAPGLGPRTAHAGPAPGGADLRTGSEAAVLAAVEDAPGRIVHRAAAGGADALVQPEWGSGPRAGLCVQLLCSVPQGSSGFMGRVERLQLGDSMNTKGLRAVDSQHF